MQFCRVRLGQSYFGADLMQDSDPGFRNPDSVIFGTFLGEIFGWVPKEQLLDLSCWPGGSSRSTPLF